MAGKAPGPAFRPDLWLTIVFVGILIEGLAADFDSGNHTGLVGFIRVVSGQAWVTSSQRAASLLYGEMSSMGATWIRRGFEEADCSTPRTPVGLVNQPGTHLVADNFPNALAA